MQAFKLKTLSSAIALALYGTTATAESTDTIDKELLDQKEEVVIYGEKQDKSLQETPVSVGVLTNEDLNNSTISDFNDVYNRLANVSITRGGNEGLFSIRGVNIEGFGNNPHNYTAGVYVDDVALDVMSIRYGAMNIWDVEQIEVYRGPQGTLQGRSALNGAMVIKTLDPTYEWSGKSQATYGNYNTKRHSVAAGGAIVDDILAFRLAAEDYRSDGYVENVTRNEEDYSGFKRQMVRGKLLFEPTDALDALLTFTHAKNNIGDNPNVPSENPFNFEAVSDHNAYHNTQTNTGSLKLTYDVNDNVTLTSVSTYADDKNYRMDDY
ncbi:MAG: TonB-dependent receptor plug domain-containing protein, partial [Cellvibrionales bacterium]|nr:TonB-dependent receptor plug domain-containing protein [Cellvibrionales bacterium]